MGTRSHSSTHPIVPDAKTAPTTPVVSRRSWLRNTAACCAGTAMGFALRGQPLYAAAPGNARIAITLDLEMSRNFPQWENTHWDYEKGNLDAATKRYAVEAGQYVKNRGGRIHYFCVGRVLEQPDVSWLEHLASDGHAIGNHTYDHVNVLAQQPSEVQFRFQRAPWLAAGRSAEEMIRDNIRLTTIALKERTGIDDRGFRTPGGFANGLVEREDVQRMLLDAGFTWVSSKYPAHANTGPREEPSEEVFDSIVNAQQQAQPFFYPTGLLEIPMSPISDIGAFRNGRWKLDWFLEAIRRSVTWAIDNHSVFDFLAHPSCLGVVDPEFRTLELICDLVDAAGDAAEIVDLDEIARSM